METKQEQITEAIDKSLKKFLNGNTQIKINITIKEKEFGAESTTKVSYTLK
ncbi:MAG: hypothetical protein ACRCSY_08210 [Cetobacterium sp.]